MAIWRAIKSQSVGQSLSLSLPLMSIASCVCVAKMIYGLNERQFVRPVAAGHECKWECQQKTENKNKHTHASREREREEEREMYGIQIWILSGTKAKAKRLHPLHDSGNYGLKFALATL